MDSNAEIWERLRLLTTELENCKAQMQKYEAEINSLKQQNQVPALPDVSQVSSRRRLIKQVAVGIAGLGALSVGAAINGSVQAQQAIEENAIEAIAGNSGYGGKFGGGIAPLRLIPTNVGIPAITGHKVGELYVDASGALFYATAPGIDNAQGWVKLAGFNTAGSLHMLGAAVRVAATIASPAPTIVTPRLKASGPNPANPPSASTIAVQIAGIGGIPAGIRGVTGVLTNVAATAAGNLRFWIGNSVPNTVNLNITGATFPPPNLSVSFAIPVDSAGRANLGYGTGVVGAECGYVVDINGYYL